MAHIDDVQQDIGFRGFRERASKGGDEVGGKLADEPDRVRQQYFLPGPDRNEPDRRVEGREKPVFNQYVGGGHQPEERRLARVGVTDHRDPRQVFPPFSLYLPFLADALKLLLEMADSGADCAAVGFDLLFSRTLRADAAVLF